MSEPHADFVPFNEDMGYGTVSNHPHVRYVQQGRKYSHSKCHVRQNDAGAWETLGPEVEASEDDETAATVAASPGVPNLTIVNIRRCGVPALRELQEAFGTPYRSKADAVRFLLAKQAEQTAEAEGVTNVEGSDGGPLPGEAGGEKGGA